MCAVSYDYHLQCLVKGYRKEVGEVSTQQSRNIYAQNLAARATKVIHRDGEGI